MKKQSILLLAGCLVFGGCGKQNVQKASREFNALPEPVQRTARARVPNGEITEVKKESRDGRVVYEIKFRDKALNPAITIAQDGTLVRYDVGTAQGRPGDFSGKTEGGSASSELTALPVAVQKAIQENAPKADVAKVSRTEQNGTVLYEIQYVGKGGNPTLVVGPDGKVTQPLQRMETRSR